MSNIATIEGKTGPDRDVSIVLSEVEEISFNFGKSILSVTAKGELSQYDMAKVTSVETTSENGQFLITVKSNTPTDQHVGEVKKTDKGPAVVGQNTQTQVPHKSDFPPKK
jgi:hypothetical protein